MDSWLPERWRGPGHTGSTTVIDDTRILTISAQDAGRALFRAFTELMDRTTEWVMVETYSYCLSARETTAPWKVLGDRATQETAGRRRADEDGGYPEQRAAAQPLPRVTETRTCRRCRVRGHIAQDCKAGIPSEQGSWVRERVGSDGRQHAIRCERQHQESWMRF